MPYLKNFIARSLILIHHFCSPTTNDALKRTQELKCLYAKILIEFDDLIKMT